MHNVNPSEENNPGGASIVPPHVDDSISRSPWIPRAPLNVISSCVRLTLPFVVPPLYRISSLKKFLRGFSSRVAFAHKVA